MDNRLHWYNFKTKEHELLDIPSDFHDYIPQIPAAQRLYDLYIQMGDAPLEACKKVLEASLGIKEDGN